MAHNRKGKSLSDPQAALLDVLASGQEETKEIVNESPHDDDDDDDGGGGGNCLMAGSTAKRNDVSTVVMKEREST